MKNLLILSIFVLISIFYFSDVSAQNLGMSLTATADRGSDIITVTGRTVSDIADVTFRVTSPSENNVIAVVQVTPDYNGYFTTEFQVGSTWEENGFYEIEAMQPVQQNSLYTIHVFVEVNNGLTEETFVTESSLYTGIYDPTVQDIGLVLDEIVIENGSTIFDVTGRTDRVSQDIMLTVTAPNGNTVYIVQIAPMLDGEFNYVIEIMGPLWKQDGFYTVTAQQFDDPKYTASTEVDIKDGTPTTETNSKCGPGTVFDPDVNSCVLTDKLSPDYPNSLCGAGTFYDEQDNACKLNHIDSEIDHSLQQENIQLKIENKQLKNQINILQLKMDNLQNIINEQIKVIMDILLESGIQ